MRLFLITTLTLSVGAGATFAQTGIATTAGATEISPPKQPPSRPQSHQNVHAGAVADCMQMWDSGTHMSKQEWLRTCKRIETRLENLNIDAVMPGTKTTSRKRASDRR